MNMDNNTYRPQEYTMADRASVEERGAFLVRTYIHLLGAIVAFMAVEALVQMTSLPVAMINLISSVGGMGWLLVLGGFMGVSVLSNRWATSNTSLGMQYAGLSLYVVGEAIIFAPLIYIAMNAGPPGVIQQAAMATAFIFTGLTAVVFITRKNFSFMGPVLGMVGLGAMALIVISILFGFSLGIFFSIVMVVMASGYILYYTSRVLHDYGTHQYVAASLALFSAVALLFWYILQIFMSRR